MQPLAERLRPRTLDEYIGQKHLVGPGAVLRKMIDAGRISSFILWGPPGVGKTTLAQIIANKLETPFYTLSAVTSGVGDRHVYAKMREGGYSLGGEQTGHTIFGDIERTGDGIMTSLRVMEVIRAERETLSQLTAPCKLLPQAQVAVRVADKDAALENMGVQNAIAEAEAALAGEGRVLVRKSGTESVIRVLAEAPDQASADAAMKRIANALEAL